MIYVVLLWLVICTWQDVRKREVDNALTIPMIVVMFLWRVWYPDGIAFLMTTLFFFLGLGGVLPGGDAKGLMAMALYSPEMTLCALLGAGLLWLILRRKFPAYVGFLVGALTYFAILVAWLAK
ncbi:MAG: prepilin peptidase [Anaerolineales bacterium]